MQKEGLVSISIPRILSSLKKTLILKIFTVLPAKTHKINKLSSVGNQPKTTQRKINPKSTLNKNLKEEGSLPKAMTDIPETESLELIDMRHYFYHFSFISLTFPINKKNRKFLIIA